VPEPVWGYSLADQGGYLLARRGGILFQLEADPGGLEGITIPGSRRWVHRSAEAFFLSGCTARSVASQGAWSIPSHKFHDEARMCMASRQSFFAGHRAVHQPANPQLGRLPGNTRVFRTVTEPILTWNGIAIASSFFPHS
jgi:hypothetical protein